MGMARGGGIARAGLRASIAAWCVTTAIAGAAASATGLSAAASLTTAASTTATCAATATVRYRFRAYRRVRFITFDNHLGHFAFQYAFNVA